MFVLFLQLSVSYVSGLLLRQGNCTTAKNGTPGSTSLPGCSLPSQFHFLPLFWDGCGFRCFSLDASMTTDLLKLFNYISCTLSCYYLTIIIFCPYTYVDQNRIKTVYMILKAALRLLQENKVRPRQGGARNHRQGVQGIGQDNVRYDRLHMSTATQVLCF